MSEKKPKRQTSLWALNLSNPESPLLKALHLFVNLPANGTRYLHEDGTLNKSRITEDLISIGLQVEFTRNNVQEGLAYLREHSHRIAVKEAIATGKPLPTATIAPQPATQTQTTPTTETSEAATVTAQPQTATQPKPVGKKRRIEGSFVISSSSHMKRTGD